MKRLLYIERLVIAGLLLLLLALAPAMAQTPVRTGETSTFAVEQHPGDVYEWELYNDGTVNFASVPGNCPPTSADFVGGNVGASVSVKWLKAGIYFFKVKATNASGCAMNFKLGVIEVKVSVKADITPPTKEVCAGEKTELEIILQGTAPWSLTYSGTNTDGVTTTKTITNITETPYKLLIDPSPTKTTDYTIISVSDTYGTNTEPSNTVKQIVNPLPLPNIIYHR